LFILFLLFAPDPRETLYLLPPLRSRQVSSITSSHLLAYYDVLLQQPRFSTTCSILVPKMTPKERPLPPGILEKSNCAEKILRTNAIRIRKSRKLDRSTAVFLEKALVTTREKPTVSHLASRKSRRIRGALVKTNPCSEHGAIRRPRP
jgi:hypothetical protein